MKRLLFISVIALAPCLTMASNTLLQCNVSSNSIMEGSPFISLEIKQQNETSIIKSTFSDDMGHIRCTSGEIPVSSREIELATLYSNKEKQLEISVILLVGVNAKEPKAFINGVYVDPKTQEQCIINAKFDCVQSKY